jgi:hypothetical protein
MSARWAILAGPSRLIELLQKAFYGAEVSKISENKDLRIYFSKRLLND